MQEVFTQQMTLRPTQSLGGPVAHRRLPGLSKNQVIVKLQQGEGAQKRLRAALEGGPQPVLANLVQDGYAAHLQPIFPIPAAPGATVASKLLSGLSTAEKEARPTLALFGIRTDPSVTPLELAQYLEQTQDEIEYAFVPPIKRVLSEPDLTSGIDPLHSRQWAHGPVAIHSARLRPGFDDASAVIVAVVDTGIDDSHPDLASVISKYANYVSSEDKRDIVGHGTHVSGIISAGIRNAIGVEGLCGAKIMVVKGLPRKEADYDAEEYYRALDHPIRHGAQVINLSLGGGYDPAERDILEDALDAGIIVVAAMGNEYELGNPIEYPAAYAGVIAVGASDEVDRRASFSNTGDHIDLVAPGVRILSTVPTYPSALSTALEYDSWDGTSMATPHVAAAAALLKAKYPKITPAEVQERLRDSCDPVAQAPQTPDPEYGWGRLNFDRALL